MALRHSVKNGAGTITRMPMPVQGDAHREIRNGYPAGIYIPRDPGRRTRLLQDLGYLPRNTTPEGSAVTNEPTTPDWGDAT